MMERLACDTKQQGGRAYAAIPSVPIAGAVVVFDVAKVVRLQSKRTAY